jgi:hypothetical protein
MGDAKQSTSASGSCQLEGNVKHVIYIQFDNVHLTRDNPNVPSDLEQMPHLRNFLENNGTLFDSTTRSSSRTRQAGSSTLSRVSTPTAWE